MHKSLVGLIIGIVGAVSAVAFAESPKSGYPAQVLDVPFSTEVFVQPTREYASSWRRVGSTNSQGGKIVVPACYRWRMRLKFSPHLKREKNTQLIATVLGQYQPPAVQIYDFKTFAPLLPQIKGLYFDRCTRLDEVELKTIAATGALESLAFNECRCKVMTDQNMGIFSIMTGLRELQLKSIRLSDACLEHVAKIKKLERLNIRGLKITVRRVLDILAENPSWEDLRRDHPEFEDDHPARCDRLGP